MSENTPHTPENDDLPTAEDWANINFDGATACSMPDAADDEPVGPSVRDTAESAADSPAAPEAQQGEAEQGEADSTAPAEGLEDLDDPLGDSELATALSRIEDLEDQVARAKADYYNLNTEYGNYVRRAKEAVPTYKVAGHVDVLEALISVLDDIDAARQAGDLADGPFAAIAHKLEDTLTSKFGLTRYGAQGEDFDPTLHEALMARPNPEVDHPVIGQVLQPGYTMGERTLRVAKVLVDNPE